MKARNRLVDIPALLTLCAISFAEYADAASQRSFVGTTGIDNSNCSLAAPCRTFAAATAAVLDGGEVIVLDSGGYGAVTITKSVSIHAAPGAYAGVSVASGDGVTINGAGIAVVLRGLAINGIGGNNGVTITNAASVRVEGCAISNLVGAGIYHTAGALSVEDATIRDNAGIGVWSVGLVRASIDRARIEHNLDGIRAQDGAVVAVHDSVITRNTGVGVFAFASTAGADVVVSRSSISHNHTGAEVRSIVSGEAAFLTVTDSTVALNMSEGLLTTKLDGLVSVSIVRTTAMDNLADDLHVSANTSAYLDGSNVAELIVDSGGVIYSRDNNQVLFKIVTGTKVDEAAF